MRTLSEYRGTDDVIIIDAITSTEITALSSMIQSITANTTIAQMETMAQNNSLTYAIGKLGDEIELGGGRPRKIRHGS